MRLSDGCIRLAKESAKWIWDNVGFGSAIHIEKYGTSMMAQGTGMDEILTEFLKF